MSDHIITALDQNSGSSTANDSSQKLSLEALTTSRPNNGSSSAGDSSALVAKSALPSFQLSQDATASSGAAPSAHQSWFDRFMQAASNEIHNPVQILGVGGMGVGAGVAAAVLIGAAAPEAIAIGAVALVAAGEIQLIENMAKLGHAADAVTS